MAMLFQEAVVVLKLHAQVVDVQNIRSLVPTVLELGADTFTRWCE
jgi:hypothetical protein